MFASNLGRGFVSFEQSSYIFPEGSTGEVCLTIQANDSDIFSGLYYNFYAAGKPQAMYMHGFNYQCKTYKLATIIPSEARFQSTIRPTFTGKQEIVFIVRFRALPRNRALEFH